MRLLVGALLLVGGIAIPAGTALAGAKEADQEITTDTVVEDGSNPVIGAGLDVTVSGDGPVNLGPDPYEGCGVFTGLSGIDLATLSGTFVPGAVPEVVGPEGEIVIDPDAPTYSLIRCNAAFIRWWETGEPVPADVIDLLVRSARSRVALVSPTPETSPEGDLVTQLAAWFWVDDAAWVDASATATIPELGLAVTVTASPVSSSWNPGDGSLPIGCGQGTPWTAELPDDAVSDCQYIYSSVAEEPLLLSSTVNYTTSVSCVPAAICAGVPPLGGIAVTTSREVVVTQIRSVLTS